MLSTRLLAAERLQLPLLSRKERAMMRALIADMNDVHSLCTSADSKLDQEVGKRTSLVVYS